MHLCFISKNRYTPNELRYLPLNTALYEPPLDPDLPALDSEPDSDDVEDGKDEKKKKNSSVRYMSCNYSCGGSDHFKVHKGISSNISYIRTYYAPPPPVFLYRTVLLEMHLTWRARREEVDMVKSSRAKRVVIATLPPTNLPQPTR